MQNGPVCGVGEQGQIGKRVSAGKPGYGQSRERAGSARGQGQRQHKTGQGGRDALTGTGSVTGQVWGQDQAGETAGQWHISTVYDTAS